MVSALRDRDDASAMAPQRRIGDIEQLAARNASSPWVVVALGGGLTDLHPAVEAALYRVTQDAVTNAHRHAQHATWVQVAVNGGPTQVR